MPNHTQINLHLYETPRATLNHWGIYYSLIIHLDSYGNEIAIYSSDKNHEQIRAMADALNAKIVYQFSNHDPILNTEPPPLPTAEPEDDTIPF